MTSVTVFCKMSAYNTNKKYLQKKKTFDKQDFVENKWII